MNFKLDKYAPKKGVNRKPGECDQLLNTTPMRVIGSETTRYGYSSAGLPALPSGITADYIRYASTENPETKEVIFLFGRDGSNNKHIYMYGWVRPGGTTFTDEWVLLDESMSETTDADISFSGSTMTVVGTIAKGYSTTANYYKGWVIKNTSQTEYAYIKSNTYAATAGGTIVFTLVEDVDGSPGFSWLTTDNYTLYRWFHDAQGFDPSYGVPSVKTIDGNFRISLGKDGSAPIWVGYLNRTFWPGEADTFTYQGTYVSKREITDATVDLASVSVATSTLSGNDVALETGFTYYVAVVPIFDGFQHGQPNTLLGGGTYLTTAARKLTATIRIRAGLLNKRITAFDFYMASDKGDTAPTTGRVNPFLFLGRQSITDANNTSWTFEASTNQYFQMAFSIDKNVWNSRGGRWESVAGYQDGTTTMLPYDLEVGFSGRQFTARTSDLDTIYTNPMSSSGIVQPDIFSDEPDIFSVRVLWGDSSFITGLIPTDRGRLVVLKDRAVVDMGIDVLQDGSVGFRPTVISTADGCASINGYVQTPFGIYFAGYNDIYKLEGLSLVPLTIQDWDYSAISTANKQASIMWYREDEKAIFVQFSSDVYAYYFMTKSWRQVTYAHTVGSYSVKRDSTIVWLASGTGYKFDTSSDDAGTGISAKWKTGNMRLTPEGTVGIYVEAWVNKNQVASTGTLDCNVKRTCDGTTTTESLEALTKSTTRLLLPLGIDDSRMFDFLSIEYNQDASPETGVVEFNGIELTFRQQIKQAAA